MGRECSKITYIANLLLHLGILPSLPCESLNLSLDVRRPKESQPACAVNIGAGRAALLGRFLLLSALLHPILSDSEAAAPGGRGRVERAGAHA